MPFFDTANVVAFVVDTRDWAHLGESLKLFQSYARCPGSADLHRIAENESLKAADLLVILNKCDLLHRRVKNDKKRAKYFPKDRTFDQVLGTIKQLFKQAHQSARRNTGLIIFQSVAHDIKSVDAIIASVAEQILRKYIV